MLTKDQIIPAIQKIYQLEGAKVTWYCRGRGHVFAHVELPNGGVLEVIFDRLSRLVNFSEHHNFGAAKPQVDNCVETSNEINIDDLPF